MKLLAIILASSCLMWGEYTTKTGKVQHKTRECWSLSRSKVVNEITAEQAKTLKPCGICYRTKVAK